MRKLFKNVSIGIVLMALSIGWVIVAPWLSANRFISVWSELSSYWFCLANVVLGALVYIMNRSGAPSRVSLGMRCVTAVTALTVVVALSTASNRVFFFWKLRSIPSDAWGEMVSDLEKVGRLSAEGNVNHLSGTKAPPKSLQQLGMGSDYVGGAAQTVNLAGYKGVVTHIEFGNKVRVWGIYCGPERLLDGFCPNSKRVRVGENAFFFAGSRG